MERLIQTKLEAYRVAPGDWVSHPIFDEWPFKVGEVVDYGDVLVIQSASPDIKGLAISPHRELTVLIPSGPGF